MLQIVTIIHYLQYIVNIIPKNFFDTLSCDCTQSNKAELLKSSALILWLLSIYFFSPASSISSLRFLKMNAGSLMTHLIVEKKGERKCERLLVSSGIFNEICNFLKAD